MSLDTIMPAVKQCGATALDIWPQFHANQREQLDEIGTASFVEMLVEHDISLGCITQYKLGPFGLRDEMILAHDLGCQTIVTGAEGPKGLSGVALRSAIGHFVEQMKPHVSFAQEHNITIAIENHGGNLIDSPDAMKWLMDLRPSDNLGIAFAPYHLPQDEHLLSTLIRDLGNQIKVFYAWQYGHGCVEKLAKQEELAQLPGRGELDFSLLLSALQEVQYQGWTEIFMHPVPRGIPILNTATQVTSAINEARNYLTTCLQ